LSLIFVTGYIVKLITFGELEWDFCQYCDNDFFHVDLNKMFEATVPVALHLLSHWFLYCKLQSYKDGKSGAFRYFYWGAMDPPTGHQAVQLCHTTATKKICGSGRQSSQNIRMLTDLYESDVAICIMQVCPFVNLI